MTRCNNTFSFLKETKILNKSSKVSDKVLGIDLGTTYSVTAILEGGKPVVIPNLDGDKTTPSVVAFGQNGTVIIGRNAKRQAVVNPLNTYFSIKRYMGKKNADLLKKSSFFFISNEYLIRSFEVAGEQRIGEFNDEIIYAPDSDFLSKSVLLKSPALKEGLRPEFVIAKLLQKLASDASEYVKETINKVVITVPAYFDDLQRKATTAAGTIAGLDVVKIINEPSSAAFAYGYDKILDERLLVFDLGGGTFDVSVLEISGCLFEVLSTGGDSALGGDDFDQAIVSYIISDFYVNGGQDLSFQPNALQRILESAEAAKIKLSASPSAVINLPFLCSARLGVPNDLTSIKFNFSKELFEGLTTGLVDRCLSCIELVLNDARLSVDDLSRNILVGGSTRIPCIKNMLFDYLGKLSSDSINPDEVVALGAALQGGLISGELNNIVLLDVLALSLGVEVDGGAMQNLVPRNTVIPVSRAQTFSTSLDNQPSVQVHVLQGERLMAIDNRSLGIFELSVQKAAAGMPRIDITFDISSDGVLDVTGVDSVTNEAQKISVSLDSNLSPEQIETLVEKAKDNTLLDKRRVKAAYLRVRLNKIDSDFKSVSNPNGLKSLGLDKDAIYDLSGQIFDLERKSKSSNQGTSSADSVDGKPPFALLEQEIDSTLITWETVLLFYKNNGKDIKNKKSSGYL